jgi:DNA-binding HxlR family transcriptional regulator
MARIRHKALDCSPGCVVEATLQLIDGKWKGVVLFHLFESSKLRFNEIRRLLPNVHPAHADQSVARAGG